MSSHLTDKSLQLESVLGGWALARRRTFAEPGVEPHYAPDRTCRIEHIDVHLGIDPVRRTFCGKATLRLAPVAGGGSVARLDLDEVVVDNVTDAAGNPLGWTHADGVLAIESLGEVVVTWHGASPRRGLYFVGPTAAEPHRLAEAWTQCQDQDAHFLLPCFDHPSVKHTWSITIVAPAPYTVVSNGRFLGREENAWRWAVDAPMPAYLFSAIAMEADVHLAADSPVEARYVVPRGSDNAAVERAFRKTPSMIGFLSALYGDYPWPRYDQIIVHDFIFGGMENLAATTLTDVTLVDARAALDNDLDDLVVHELAHQWFGDLLTCQDWSQGWLNEGWATYTESLWLAHDRGTDAAAWHLYEQMGQYLSEDGDRYRRPIVSYLFRAPIDVFDRHLYEKGALVLHTLRTVLGDDAFWGGVRLYLTRHRFQTVHTRHFQRALEDATGRCLDQFFAEWVYGAGHPALDVTVAWSDGALSVTVKQKQEGEGVAPIFHFPLVIEFGGERRTLSIDARERTYSMPCAVVPTFVAVDPGFRVLAEVKFKAPRSMLVAQLAADPCVVGRIRAAVALGEEASPEAIDALIGALRNGEFYGVRGEIADVLAARGGNAETAALLGATLTADARVRQRVVAALSKIRRPEVAAALAALPEDASIMVEGEIVRVLGKHRAVGVHARAERALAMDSWCEILRARALEALGHTRDPRVFETIVAWTSAEKPARARAAAAAALSRLGDEVEETRTRAVERLIILAEDEQFRVQVAAISWLGHLKDTRALAVLTRIHDSSPDGRCRRLAFEAMTVIRDGRTTDAGLSGLKRELEGLVEENRKLRDRVGKLEERK